jgi:putative aldouronate transport system permease protein
MIKILLPMVKSTVAVIAMFLVLMKWNSWFQESIYLSRSRNLWPLQLFMREILVQNDTKMITASEAAGMANLVSNLVKHCITVVGTLPVLIVYPFAQKYFVQGITLGGVKG